MDTLYAALIPLRGGSKSIKNKNIIDVAGKPLCAWVLDAAIRSQKISKVFVSTDSSDIRRVIEERYDDVHIIDRPASLATDTASTEDVMLHAAKVVEFDVLCTIQATSPLLTDRDLDQAIETMDAGGYDSMLSAVRTKRFFWTDDFRPINYDPAHRPRRQDFDGSLMENGAFYLTRRELLETERCRLGGHIGIHIMDEESGAEIDEPSDLVLVEHLLKKRSSV